MGKMTEKNAVVCVWNEVTSAREECKFANEAEKNVCII
jgi:hypothetical protein